ncbi:MAG: fibronectin type III domain-containing protein [Candidatus Saccharimonas sp.]|nr:fibronectin type III domain-containing protein [Planctomycetaceae bacterium]
MAKVKLSLRNLTVPQKVQFMRQIVTAMTGNADYPTPSPPLATITTLANQLETDFNAAEASRLVSEQKTAVMGTSEDAADAGLTQLGAHVDNASGGDEEKILGAGMDVRATPAPVGSLPAPQGLVATIGDFDGEIDNVWDAVRGASSYVMEKSVDPPTATSWQPAGVTTKSQRTVTGLTSGTKYWFRVAALGAAGQSPWSNPASRTAQ